MSPVIEALVAAAAGIATVNGVRNFVAGTRIERALKHFETSCDLQAQHMDKVRHAAADLLKRLRQAAYMAESAQKLPERMRAPELPPEVASPPAMPRLRTPAQRARAARRRPSSD
jgi:hypothetical protein